MEPIAIVGIGCRFGNATTPAEFFEMLIQGVDATRDVPEDRWSLRSFYDPDRGIPGKLSTYRGGFLPNIDRFDARFFGISPREAAYMDPQQRILLEISWEALEDAGLVPEQLAGSNAGVFMGAFTLDYKGIQLGRLNRRNIDAHTATGSMMTMVSNRISYVFDFRGPSMSIDTACSSSLVAVHLACQSLRNGECSTALAGGVNVMVTPEYTIAESKGGFLSPDGRSKPFSAAANGYGRAEGAGVLVLQPLSAALAAGVPVYAIIRGSAINQDGHTNGITVPSGDAQERLIREACRRAGVTPAQIQYVEAHGTGTPVGDPIEARALGAALACGRDARERCVVGSVKGNIGHMEAAAGAAGLIKAALSLQQGVIPPNLHFEKPNPKIPFEQLQLRVPTTAEPWPAHDGPALAGVNSFGFGGTNAHVVLEQAPARGDGSSHAANDVPGLPLVFPLSARSPEALDAAARSMREFAANAEARSIPFADVYYSAALRRSHHDHRLAVVAGTNGELAAALDAHLTGESRSGIALGARPTSGRPRIVFVCTGMGPQQWAMGRGLFAAEPVFRQAFLACDELFRAGGGSSPLDEMMSDESASHMAETYMAQTANFAIQVALAALWKSWGVEPDAIVGHSVGEVSASYLAGALSLDDAVRVSIHRSRLQQTTAGRGGMMALGVPVEQAEAAIAHCAGRVSIAAVNSPSSATISGDPATIRELSDRFTREHVFNRIMRVNVAYHSPQMDPLRAELLEVLAGLTPRSASVPLYSTVTGGRVDGSEFDAGYWWRNMRQPVLFRKAMDALFDAGFDCFLEIGPHPVLASSISECLASRGRKAGLFSSLRRGEDERSAMLGNLAALYTIGMPVNWHAFERPGARFVRLPVYPWQRERHWAETPESVADRTAKPVHPLLGHRVPGAIPAYATEINPHHLDYLRDHGVQGAVVFPGAGYIEMALAAAREIFAGSNCSVEQVRFEHALFLSDSERPKLQITCDPERATFEICSRSADRDWVRNASGALRQQQACEPPAIDLEPIRSRCARHADRETCYEQFRAQGFHYGPAFRKIDSIWLGDGEALARFDTFDIGQPDYRLHPTVLDACFQVLVATDPFGAGRTYLPVSIERIRIHRPPEEGLLAWARLDRRTASGASGSIYLCDAAGNVVLEIEGFEVRALESVESPVSAEQIDRWLYAMEWKPAAPAEKGPLSPGTWLLFADAGAVAERLAKALRSDGAEALIVEPGAGYEFCAETRRCTIDPAAPEQYTRLLDDAAAASIAVTGVAHFWSLDLSQDDLDGAESLGCLSVMHLVQALAALSRPPKLWLVTRGAQPVVGSGGAALAQAPLWGLGRVIGHQEHIAMWGGLIDLDPAAPDGEIEQIAAELRHLQSEDQIALRGDLRFAARLERSGNLTPALPVCLRPDASYLVTGGLGALGMLTARWMVERGARRIILMGRTTLPERSAWKSVEAGTEAGKRIAAIRELESMGANITLASVDVADAAQLDAFLRSYESEAWPPIRGVVHSAGLVRDQLLLQMDERAFQSVLRPKVRGSWNLHRAFLRAPLDFFVLYSSIGSLVVSTGQANYAAGNAFLDALAQHRRAAGLPALSINWGPWAIGMVNDLHLVDHYAARGLDAIRPQQGMQVLGRLLGQPVAQAAVVSVDWQRLFGFQPKVSPMVAHLAAETNAGAPQAAETQSFLERLLDTEPEAQPVFLSEQIREMAARVLRLDRNRIATDQPLSVFGLDSMMATELANRVQLTLGVPVAVLELLKGISIGELASSLLPQLLENGELEKLLAEVEQQAA